MAVNVGSVAVSVDPLISEAKRRRRNRRLLAAAGVVLVVAAAVGLTLGLRAPGGGKSGTGSPAAPTGDPQGIALLSQAESAYQKVPAVEATTRRAGARSRTLWLLQNGVIAGEQYTANTPGDTYAILARQGNPTFARGWGSRCWHRLEAPSPAWVHDLGVRFPDQYFVYGKVGVPHRAGRLWFVPVVAGDGPNTVISINARTHLVESVSPPNVAFSGQVTTHPQALTRAPSLLNPTPLCSK